MTHWSDTLTAQHAGDGHLRVWRRDGSDGIGWDELQAVKDEMLGPDVLAVEMYPPADRVVNEANIRHLWTVPADSFTFGLHRR